MELQTITPTTVATPTPMDLLGIAMSKGADLEQLQKLMELQERWEANEARKAYVAAMAAFKANPPTIIKDKLVAYGNTKYKHAELEQVSSVIGAALSAVGISHRWNVEQPDGRIRVACILTHNMGHTEQVVMEGPADNSGQKNAIQAIASAVSYLQRYTLLAATGVATGEADNDGRGADAGLAAAARVAAAENMADLQAIYTLELKAAQAARDKAAQTAIIAAKDRRKAELSSGVAA